MIEKFSILYSDKINEVIDIGGYSIFPNSGQEVRDPDMVSLVSLVRGYYDNNGLEWDSPIAIHSKESNKVKVRRSLNNSKFKDYVKIGGIDLSKEKGNRYGKLVIDYGDGSRGGRGSANKGASFESNLASDLRVYSNSGYDKKLFNYPELVLGIVEKFDLGSAKEIIVKETGTSDTKRPLVFNPGPKIEKMVNGSKVADLVLVVDKKEYYLSLKYGKGTLALFNIGISKILNEKDLVDGVVNNRDGIILLDMLGIDKEIFARVFNEFGKVNFTEYNTSISSGNDKLEDFLHSGFGKGYYMVHGYEGGYDFYEIDEKFAKESSIIVSNIDIEYGGASGKSKQVNLKFSTKNFKFNIKFRNSAGGIYPTHIFGEYKKIK